jgi:amino acid adenylation domain-containing protein
MTFSLLNATLPKEPPVPSSAPLSLAQTQAWVVEQLLPDTPLYTLAFRITVRGTVAEAGIRAALRHVTVRQSSFRTRFIEIEGTPAQIVEPAVEIPFDVIEMRDVAPHLHASFLRQRVQTWVQIPFRLNHAPLVRALWIPQSDTHATLLIAMHHIVSDASSTALIVQEVGAYYQAWLDGDPAPLAPLPLSYAEYARAQRATWKADPFWAAQYADGLPHLDLPTDFPRPALLTFAGGTVRRPLSYYQQTELARVGQQSNATLFMTLLALYSLWLYRYSGQQDMVIGVPVSVREQADLNDVVGFLVNTLPVRVRWQGDPLFQDLVTHVRTLTLAALSHPHFTPEQLLAPLAQERTTLLTSLYQVMFSYQNLPSPTVPIPYGTLEFDGEVETGTAKCDITLFVDRVGDETILRLEYNRDLFSEATMHRRLDQLIVMIDSIILRPASRLSEIAWWTASEQKQLLRTWNTTTVPFDANDSFLCMWERQVEQRPSAIAMVARDTTLTYSTLNDAATNLAATLQAVGIRREAPIALFLQRDDPDLLVALLAILKAGGAYLPLDPTHPPGRVAFMLQDAAVRWVLTTSALHALLPADATNVLHVDQPRLAAPYTPVTVLPEQLVYVLYTSGSTGTPKGVMVTHAGLANYLRWAQGAYDTGGIGSPVHSPLSFDLTVTSLLLPLTLGQRVQLLPATVGAEALRDALLAEAGWSVLKLTPAHLDLLRETLRLEQLATRRHLFVIGGEALSAAQIAPWREACPQLRLVNEYGPTETVVGCCIYEVPDTLTESGTLPIGRPIANTEIYLLDRYLAPVPVGVMGELYIGGLGVARGYLHRPALTAARFVPNPFGAAGSRLYRSGDVAKYRSDGTLEFHGRADRQIKLRGYRIEPGEIEALLRHQPTVRDVVVTVYGTQLVAYVVPTSGTVPVSELLDMARRLLPAYMVPDHIVPLSALPLSANGKIAWSELPAPLAMPAPAVTLPATPFEELTHDIWQAVLGRTDIDTGAHFFRLGGHSLLAAQVVSRLGNRLDIEIPLLTLFEYPILRDFAAAVEALLWAEVDALDDDDAARLLEED